MSAPAAELNDVSLSLGSTPVLEDVTLRIERNDYLAILGPIETDVGPVELVDGEELTIGSDVYLIGYPGEVDEFPEPTITRGLISRLRQWEPVDVTFF